MRQKNDELQEIIESNDDMDKKLCYMTNINENMLTTIENVGNDNIAYTCVMKKLRDELETLRTRN